MLINHILFTLLRQVPGLANQFKIENHLSKRDLHLMTIRLPQSELSDIKQTEKRLQASLI